MARQTGRAPAALLGPPCPEVAAPVWNAYLELAGRRTWSMGGPSPIGWPELAAWSKLRRVRLDDFELACLGALEQAWFRVRNEQR